MACKWAKHMLDAHCFAVYFALNYVLNSTELESADHKIAFIKVNATTLIQFLAKDESLHRAELPFTADIPRSIAEEMLCRVKTIGDELVSS
jgi:hypothetical protein